MWNNINSQAAKISTIIADKDYYEDWQRFKLDLFSVIKKSVSWDPVEGEGHLDTLLRSIVLGQVIVQSFTLDLNLLN